MKIVCKQPEKTADISSGRGSAAKEFRNLILLTCLLLVGLYFLTGLIVDAGVARISFETEAKIFRNLQIPFPSAPSGYEDGLKKVREILEKLTTGTKAPPLPYRIVVIEEKSPNAFAFPGGTIGITTGLLEALDGEIEMAFVIAHELGHFHNRDHLRGIGRAVGIGLIVTTIFGGSGADIVGGSLNFVLERNYSRQREKNADLFGLSLVHSIYGRVEGTDRLFRILQEDTKLPGWAYMFSTHPDPEERIEAMKKEAETFASQEP